MKNAYLAPEAEFLCVSTATEILWDSRDIGGATIPMSVDEEA